MRSDGHSEFHVDLEERKLARRAMDTRGAFEAISSRHAMDLVFRETLPSDIEGLFSVRARTRESPISKEGLASIGVTAESIARQMASGRVKGWVCLDSSILVGFCNGDAETGEVLVLAVLPDYERRGIGTYLLSRVVEWLRSAGSSTIWLAASPDPRMRAHGFYRSLGWRANGKKQQNGDEILTLESDKPHCRSISC